MAKLTPRIIPTPTHNNKALDIFIPASIEKMLPPILAKSQKENTKPVNIMPNKSYVQALKQSYAQASKQVNNTSEVIKIKKTFPVLNAQKVDQIHKIVNSTPKSKLRIQITTKDSSRKHIIIPMSNDNILKFIKESLLHVANINWALKNAKSEILVDIIRSDMASIIVVTNKVVIQSDLYIIENYITKVDNINIINVDTFHLPQLKSYLKIIGILYYPYDLSNKCLTSNDVEDIIKQNQIFDNVVLASKLQVIKVSPKSAISII